MAEPSGSTTSNNDSSQNNDNLHSPPDAPAAAAPPQHDWEVLSMSMSASAFGTPGSASVVCNCDFCTGKSSTPDSACVAALHPVSMLPQSLASSMSSDPSTTNVSSMVEQKLEGAVDNSMPADASSADFDNPVRNWLHQSAADHSGDMQDGGKRIVSGSADEPFTAGWKPRPRNSPADLMVDLTPGTLRTFPAFSDTPSGDVNRAPYQKEVNDGSNFGSVDKDVYTAETGFGMIEGTAEAQSKLNLVEGEKVVKKKSGTFSKNRSSVAWWTRQASLWRFQARDANTLWSIALAASVVGIVVLGYRWQRERSQNQQLRLQLYTQDEKIGDLRNQVTRLKDVITGRRRVAVTRGSY